MWRITYVNTRYNTEKDYIILLLCGYNNYYTLSKNSLLTQHIIIAYSFDIFKQKQEKKSLSFFHIFIFIHNKMGFNNAPLGVGYFPDIRTPQPKNCLVLLDAHFKMFRNFVK